jgi:hypothetical protein
LFMPLRVQCSAGHLMMVPDHRAGTVLRCANCGIDVQVPPAPGEANNETGKPRVTAPAIKRPEARQGSGPAARQSPQVAGHSTAAKSGINLPTVGKKPGSSRSKSPALTITQPSPERPVPSPDRIVITASEVAVPPPAIAQQPTGAETESQSGRETPIVVAEISPEKPLRIEVAQVIQQPPAQETPPAETVQPHRQKQEPIKPAAKPSNRARTTLTGTMISPDPAPAIAQPVAKVEPVKKIDRAREEPPAEVAREANAKTIVESHRAEPKPPPVALPVVQEPPPSPPHEVSFHSAATQVDPTPPPRMVIQGVQPTAAQRMTVWQLAAALLAALLLSVGPSLWEITDYLRSENGHSVARWAFLLLMLGVVQFGCILLLVQVPDWCSVWIVTLQSLALAAIYAAILGLTIITSGDSPLIGALQLDYQYSSGKAPPWCVCLAATYACLAFFAGRLSAKWRKVLKQVQKTEEATASHAY